MTKTETVREVSFTTVLPSGIEVYFQSEPRRLYRVNGEEVVSVTEALEILHKPQLISWAQRTGVGGTLSLLEDGQIQTQKAEDKFEVFAQQPTVDGQRAWTKADEESVLDLLKEHKLTTSHKKSAGGRRGESVHEAFRNWIENGVIPVPDNYPETEVGYIHGLLAFINDFGPVSNAEIELVVASADYGFAGRTDALCDHQACRLVTKKETPKGKFPAQYTDFQAGRAMLDCKTSKDIYLTNHLQLEGYGLALSESGYKPVDQRFVVNMNMDGKYEVAPSMATEDQFLAVVSLYYALADFKSTSKEDTDE